MSVSIDGTSGIDTVQKAALVGKLPAGSVLQVVNATYGTQASNSTSTFADTGLTATITPTSATSKILILVDHADCANGYSNGSLLKIALLRNSTSINTFTSYAGFFNGGANVIDFGSCSTSYLDSPATTSATTYKTQLASTNNTGLMYTNYTGNSNSTITLMEISA